MKTSLLSAFAVLLLASGCKSTHRYDVLAPNDPIPLTVNSTEIYKWDTDKSTPYNLAKMGYGSNLGKGVYDSRKPMDNAVGKSSSGLSAMSGYLAGGVFGGLGMLSISSGTNSDREWNPYIIDFIPMSELDVSNPVVAGKVAQVRLGNFFETAMAKMDNATYHGVYYQKNKRIPTDNYIVHSGSVCETGIEFMHTANNPIAKTERYWQKNIVDISEEANSLATGCAIGFKSSVAGVYNDHYIVTHEVVGNNIGLYFMMKTAESLTVPSVFPDTVNISDVNNGEKKTVHFATSFAYVENKELYFDSAEKSVPIL